MEIFKYQIRIDKDILNILGLETGKPHPFLDILIAIPI